MSKLFLFMLVMTISEIYFLITVGGFIGTLPTLLLIITTALIGSWQIKKQGSLELKKITSMQSNPDDVILVGLILVVAGVMLITPGFITDIVGLSLLSPKIRTKTINYLKKQGSVFFSNTANSHTFTHTYSSTKKSSTEKESSVIEGEFVRKNDKD